MNFSLKIWENMFQQLHCHLILIPNQTFPEMILSTKISLTLRMPLNPSKIHRHNLQSRITNRVHIFVQMTNDLIS